MEEDVQKTEIPREATLSSNGNNSITVIASDSQLSDYLCLLGAYLFFRLPWVFMLPMVEAPDEFAHYWVIKFLKENMRLPQALDVAAGGPSAIYGSIPQLGYIPHVIFSFALPPEQLALADRFGSVFMGAVMLIAAFKVGAILFPSNRWLALSLPAAIACHPQLAFIHSYANSDSTSSALASILLWLTLETAKKGISLQRTSVMGALVGWLAITKYAGLAIIPVVGLALIASIFVQGTSLVLAAQSILCAGILAATLSIWWFVQNAQQYPGDFMGTHTMYASWAKTFHRDMNYYLPASHIIKSLRWWRMTFFSYWGLFGYMTKYLWRPVYFVYLGLVLAAVLGVLKGAYQLFAISSGGAAKLIPLFKEKQNQINIIMWGSLALTGVINIVSMIWASMYNLGGPQGRYLITSEIPLMALMLGGLSLLGKKAGKHFVMAFLLFNVAVSIGSWIYLFRLYGGWHLDPLIN